MKILFNKNEKQNILALINDKKQVDLPEAEITISAPTVVNTTAVDASAPNQEPLNLNTKVTISVSAESRAYEGEHDFKYRRINLATQWDVLYGTRDITYTKEDLGLEESDEVSETDLKDYVLSLMKVLDSSVTVSSAFDNDKASSAITISPIENSLVYVPDNTTNGQEEPLVINISKKKVELKDFIAKNLNGLEYEVPEEAEGKQTEVRGFGYGV